MATSWLVCLRDDGFAVPVRWWDGARYVDTSPSRAGWSDGETATCCSFDNLQLEGRLASKGKPSSVSLLSLSPESCQQNNATDDDNGKEYRCLPYRLGGSSCLQLAKFILSSSLFFFFFVRIFKSIPLSSPNESPICKIQGDKLCLLRQFCSAAVSQYALPPNFHIVHKEKDLRAHPLQNAKAHAHQPALHF